MERRLTYIQLLEAVTTSSSVRLYICAVTYMTEIPLHVT